MPTTYKFSNGEIIIPDPTMDAELHVLLKNYLDNYEIEQEPIIYQIVDITFDGKTYQIPAPMQDIIRVAADFNPPLDFTADTVYNKMKRLFETSFEKNGIILTKKVTEPPPVYNGNIVTDRDRQIEAALTAAKLLPVVALLGAAVVITNISH